MDSERIEIRRGDITALNVDAIVNAANRQLAPGGGVCGAIHSAAGPQLAGACRDAGSCETGGARLTPGFDLGARYVIHAVGPVWDGGGQGEPDQLASCYRRSLELARDVLCDSIAFPAISTGIFGYPLESACEVAVDTILTFVADNDRPRRIVLCAFDETTEDALREALRGHDEETR